LISSLFVSYTLEWKTARAQFIIVGNHKRHTHQEVEVASECRGTVVRWKQANEEWREEKALGCLWREEMWCEMAGRQVLTTPTFLDLPPSIKRYIWLYCCLYIVDSLQEYVVASCASGRQPPPLLPYITNSFHPSDPVLPANNNSDGGCPDADLSPLPAVGFHLHLWFWDWSVSSSTGMKHNNFFGRMQN
jgi:hypothetical protein